MLSCFSRVLLSATPWTVARQAPLSMGWSRQGHWSRLPFPPLGDLPDPGMEPVSLMCLEPSGGFYTTSATWEAPLLPWLLSRRFRPFLVFISSYTGSLLLLGGFSLAVGNGGYSLVVVHRPLTAMTSPAVKSRLQDVRAQGCHMCVLGSCSSRAVACRLSGSGTRAELLWRMWDLPRPGIEPVCPGLAGRFFTTGPPGKSHFWSFKYRAWPSRTQCIKSG